MTQRIESLSAGMLIEYAKDRDARYIHALLGRCRDRLLEQGIRQWDSEYPSLDYVKGDIARQSLAKLCVDEKIVGIVTFDDLEEPAYRTVSWRFVVDRVAVIHRLAVDPGSQGQGLAALLMAFAERTIADNGIQAIRLDAYSGNDRLLDFYYKKGYRKAGEIYFPRRDLPFFCMEKLVKYEGL